ncbi:MAG: hypothetical protein ACPHL6_06990, partial [Rubripirellula sp.]
MKTQGKPIFEIPESLRTQLIRFRQRLWLTKVLEALAFAAIGFLVGFIATFCLDRFIETSRWFRWSVFGGSALTFASIPYAIERWVWKQRRFEQLAKLLTRTKPNVGDQILGVIHLVSDRQEQTRSPELVKAAISQVAGNLRGQDLRTFLPRPRVKRRGLYAMAFAGVSCFLFAISSDAASNSLNRFLKPWSDVQRYTFAQLKPIRSPIVVPKGEEITLPVEFAENSRWKPEIARVRLARSVPYEAKKIGERFTFQLPGQVVETTLDLKVGDYQGEFLIQPVARPELQSLIAMVRLPEYLQRPDTESFEVRGGTVSLLRGSQISLTGKATRPLKEASVNGKMVAVNADGFAMRTIEITDSQKVTLDWRDHYDLSAVRPTEIGFDCNDDELPSLVCEGLALR